MSSLTSVIEHVGKVVIEFENGLECHVKNEGTKFTGDEMVGLREKKNKFISVLRDHCLSYLTLWHLRAAIKNVKIYVTSLTDQQIKLRVF